MNFTNWLFVPKQAVGANLVYFDLFNNSKNVLEIVRVNPVVSGAVAVVGVVGVDLHLTYTSAVGTGGTAATYDGTDTTACTFGKNNPGGQPATTLVSARLTPTGGATAAGVVGWTCVFTEETSAPTYNKYSLLEDGQTIYIPNGKGIRVVQGAVASVGNIGFNVGFNILGTDK